MKRRNPWFQAYWSDLDMDALQHCSLSARGLWMEMYKVMHRDPVGKLQIGARVITKQDLFYSARLTIKDFPLLNLGGKLEFNLEVGLEEYRKAFDLLYLELFEAGLFEEREGGLIASPVLEKRDEIRRRRAAGGHLGGNPKLKRPRNGPVEQPSRLTTKADPENNPKEKGRDLKKKPSVSAASRPHPQRERLSKIAALFERFDRQPPPRPGAYAKRLSDYARVRGGDLDQGLEDLLFDLEDLGRRGKLISSGYVLRVLDGQLEQRRTGRGIGGPGRRPDAGQNHETRALVEDLDL